MAGMRLVDRANLSQRFAPVHKGTHSAWADDGGGGGYRTPDPRLMSPLLYQLSYTAIPSLLGPVSPLDNIGLHTLSIIVVLYWR